MDDFLFYSILASALIGVVIAALHTMPGCQGDCSQGRKACNCAPEKE